MAKDLSPEEREEAARYASPAAREKLGVKPSEPKPPRSATVKAAARTRQEAADRNK